MQYEITIGIPLYRAAGYIETTMQSALAQTFQSVEFLVVDDCGHDGSVEVVENLQKNHSRGLDIRILHNSENKGVSYCRNRIIEEASGRYLYFLDSDDLIEPDTLQLLYSRLCQHHCQIAYGSYEITDLVQNTPSKEYVKPYRYFDKEGDLAVFAFQNNNIFHVSVCNFLIDLDFLRKSGVRFRDASFWEDMAFTYELLTLVHSAVLLPQVTYHYRLRPGSLSHYQHKNELAKDTIQDNVSVLTDLKEVCKKHVGKRFTPYMCYNLAMSSFYVVCFAMKNAARITPSFTDSEYRQIMQFPLSLSDILFYKDRWMENIIFYMISALPPRLSVIVIKMLGRLKKAI